MSNLDDYRDQNPADELCLYLGIDFDDMLRIVKRWEGLMIDGEEVNHIFTNPRRHLQSVLITMTRRSHLAFHKSLPMGRVLCITAKLRKQVRLGLPNECTIEELNLASGRNVMGLIECYDFDGDSLMQGYQRECLTRLVELKAESAA